MSSLVIPNVVLSINNSQLSSYKNMGPDSGSVTALNINGNFFVSGSDLNIGMYNRSFILTDEETTAAISTIDTLGLAKVKGDLGIS
jgi:hypothetical protein